MTDEPHLLPAPTAAEVARFMTYVDKLPGGCWYWTGARSRGKGNRKWYGTFWYRGKSIRAHRFASEGLRRVACPPGHHRHHTCVFSMCVCPEHVVVLTSEENEELKQALRREAAVTPPRARAEKRREREASPR